MDWLIIGLYRFPHAAGIALAAMLSLMPLPATAAEGDRPVIDEGAADPGFAHARSAIIAALRLGDFDAVAAYAVEDIQLDFGGGSGRDEFNNRLRTGTGNGQTGEEYRAALEEALMFGGRFTEPGVFEAPFSFTEPLPEDLDAYDAYFVLGGEVPVRRAPSEDSELLGTVSFELVRYDETGEGNEAYIPIRSEDGSIAGFVASEHLKNPLDYRAIFEQRNEQWMLTAFIAGD